MRFTPTQLWGKNSKIMHTLAFSLEFLLIIFPKYPEDFQLSKDKNTTYFVQKGFQPIVSLNYGPGLIVSKEKLSPKF